MKISLLSLVSMILLASCSSNEQTEQQLQQHIIDSTVSIRLEKRAAENAARNDSILSRMETEKADTMEKELARQPKKAVGLTAQKHADSATKINN